MKLTEIFTQLTYGELSQLKLGENEDGEILEENYPSLIASINLGLAALFKRFTLKEGRLTLVLQAGRLTYPLYSRFAVANTKSTEIVRYIEDSASPFVDDIIKIERVYTDRKFEMGLNDTSDEWSCFTPSAVTLRVPEKVVALSADLPDGLQTAALEVVYRAAHPLLVLQGGYINPAKTEIELPYSHLEALLYFIASRVHNPIGMSNEFHAGNSWAAKYEQECVRLELLNLQVDQGSQNTHFERGGWI